MLSFVVYELNLCIVCMTYDLYYTKSLDSTFFNKLTLEWFNEETQFCVSK